MRLGTRKNGTRDGELVVVSSDTSRVLSARDVVPHLQAALDNWEHIEPALRVLAERVDELRRAGDPASETEPFDAGAMLAPLPRAYEWIDGSAYIQHIVLVRKARGAEPPETLETDPLVYQGGSGVLLGARDDVPLRDPAFGLDYEAEVGVIVGDTPEGTTAADAGRYIRLVVLINDLTLRHLVPGELAKGFGFFQSKPATAFSPLAVTPDELGGAYQEGRVHLPLRSYVNNELTGDPEAGAPMHFSFLDLIAHVTRTRSLVAGTILGSGTVSNEDAARGVSCLAERRMREVIAHGAASTPFLAAGDRVRIEMLSKDGRNLFGSIEQRVVAAG